MNKAEFRIGVYVLSRNAKATYERESYDVRLNAGVAVVCDILRRAGYTPAGYCSAATVHEFDLVLMSITSDCDWWPFAAERGTWRPGAYRVVCGGQGVLNVRPFLELADYFVLGRAEADIVPLADAIRTGADYESESVVCARTFSMAQRYRIAQAECTYPVRLELPGGQRYVEDVLGCNHRCLFCGYTWHRRHVGAEAFKYEGLWGGDADRERAILDMDAGTPVDFNRLRTTAIDGFSERLRFAVGKRIGHDMLVRFLARAARVDRPHQIKVYNICGYPTETVADWREFQRALEDADRDCGFKRSRQACFLLHSTPFRAMPATPLACAPMSLRNYRGDIGAHALKRPGDPGNVFYRGGCLWGLESQWTDSLSTVAMSAIVWRGTESDAPAILKIARAGSRFTNASSEVKLATLRKYFDLERLFARYAPEDLPTRNIGSYAQVEKMWARDPFAPRRAAHG